MRYHRPASFEEAAAIAAGASGATRFLAGGTDVLVQMRAGMTMPDDVIDLKLIPGVKDIARTADGGCLIGSTQVQGRATLAGNLCNGSPAADSVPGMMAAGAVATHRRPRGPARGGGRGHPRRPGQAPALKPGEMIASIFLPARGRAGGDAYLRFIPRTEMDIAVVGCGVNLRLDGDRSPPRASPWARSAPAAPGRGGRKAIVGSTLDEAALAALAAAATAAASRSTTSGEPPSSARTSSACWCAAPR
jgi:xanthine dehydrogenase FAD-binding subunit